MIGPWQQEGIKFTDKEGIHEGDQGKSIRKLQRLDARYFQQAGSKQQQEQAVAIWASGQPAKRATPSGVYPTKDSGK